MANQYTTDPRQVLFLQNYVDPKSDTFSNALQSALKAGYSQEYAESITAQMPDWLSEALGDSKRLKKAEKVMDEILELPAVDPEGKVDNALIGNKIKITTLYAKGLGKAKYSERHEHTGAGGRPLSLVFDPAFNKDATTRQTKTDSPE